MDAEEQTQQLLRAYGERSAPSTEQRDRAWAAIAAAATAAPPTNGVPATGNLALKSMLGIGVVALVGIAAWSWHHTPDAPRSTESPTLPPETAAAVAAAPPETTLEEEASAAEPAAMEPVSSSPDAPTISARVAASRGASPVTADGDPAGLGVAPVDPPAPPGTLAEELALMDDARAALARGDVPATLLALDQHAARFPSGTLAREREVVRVTALCVAGREDEAVAAATAAGPRPAIVRALSRCDAP